MKQFGVVCIIAILFSVHLVQAQTPEPSPAVPPDPAEIFKDGVQWSLVEPPAPHVEPVQIDYDNHVIRVNDTVKGTRQEYPFPPEVTSIFPAGVRSDGLIELHLDPGVINDLQPSDVLLLDPKTGRYESPPTVCHGQVIQAERSKGVWTVAYLDADYKTAVLCNSETGEQRDVLPSDLAEWQVFPSPDGTWLILISRNWDAFGNFQIYAYQTILNQVIPLGMVSYAIDSDVSVCGWVSDTHGLLCRFSTHEWMGTPYYAFDVTQTNSITDAFWDGRGQNVFRLETPIRYGSVESDDYQASITGGRNSNHPPCTLTLYDAAGLHLHELGYECIPVMLDEYDRAPYYRQGNILYYLTFDSPDSTVSSLRLYDVEAEAGNVAMFTGEIESILSVSPDNRYVVLLLDDNGKLDFRWQGLCCDDLGGWQVAILDTKTEQIVYHSEPIGVYIASQAEWLDNTTIVIGAARDYEQLRATDNGNTFPNEIPASLRRISLDNGVNVSSTTQVGLDRYSGLNLDRLSPGGGGYWLREDNTVIDLRTFESISVLKDNLPEQYTLHLNWAFDGELEVHVNLSNHYEDLALYRVKLD